MLSIPASCSKWSAVLGLCGHDAPDLLRAEHCGFSEPAWILPNLSEMQMVSKEAVPDCSDSDRCQFGTRTCGVPSPPDGNQNLQGSVSLANWVWEAQILGQFFFLFFSTSFGLEIMLEMGPPCLICKVSLFWPRREIPFDSGVISEPRAKPPRLGGGSEG